MRLLALILTSIVFLTADAWAAGGKCCGDDKCCASACCKHDGDATAQEQEPAPAAAREYAKVTFTNPVKVGDAVLMGSYVIEHDNDRMARGEPCTHIYKAGDLRAPVVAFHCVHLDRPLNDGETAMVTVRRLPDMNTRIFELVEFQFAGSPDGHGVPDGR